MNWLRPLLLALAAIFLALGLFLPIIRFERLYFFSETPSLLELVAVLFREGDLALSLVVGLFSIVFPIVKLAGLTVQFSGLAAEAGFFRRAMPHLSKWSMMDVMLVAIVVFAAKSSGLAVAVSQPGLWFYAASAIIAGVLPSLPRIGPGQN
ncbi:paraquat-inducible protein A [Neorhizobium galegae]|uniref:paraquat-inducible protein A n=1 Tax=Neorhizobium galegae TaxID=399 RepID=UPI001AE26F5C|nr:paraquat-inducible protein A [Neorhizobium galegae]MBP2557992.1 paraquat-inducible protein A [Neorhizobium galegae]MDQ0136782.1 paraquat-inducible protein A [Neorhizobium galegae]